MVFVYHVEELPGVIVDLELDLSLAGPPWIRDRVRDRARSRYIGIAGERLGLEGEVRVRLRVGSSGSSRR